MYLIRSERTCFPFPRANLAVLVIDPVPLSEIPFDTIGASFCATSTSPPTLMSSMPASYARPRPVLSLIALPASFPLRWLSKCFLFQHQCLTRCCFIQPLLTHSARLHTLQTRSESRELSCTSLGQVEVGGTGEQETYGFGSVVPAALR